jgi:hypothetical protein
MPRSILQLSFLDFRVTVTQTEGAEGCDFLCKGLQAQSNTTLRNTWGGRYVLQTGGPHWTWDLFGESGTMRHKYPRSLQNCFSAPLPLIEDIGVPQQNRKVWSSLLLY